MSLQAWTYVFVFTTFALYLGVAWVTRVKDTHGFYVAGRGVPAIANGMATAADWMSAASFLSMAGMIGFLGYAGSVYLMGWTGGYVLLALLLAPWLRKFGSFTVPDFVGDRFESHGARLVALICALFVSFTYVAGQMRGVGIVFSRFLEVDIEVGVILGMGIVFVYATLGGMKGITWTQVAQYWVLITAFLIPAIAISIRLTGQSVPQIGMGSELLDAAGKSTGTTLLAKLDALHRDLGFHEYTATFEGDWGRMEVMLTTLALMAGTAGLPHVIVRFYTVRSLAAARWSGFWALAFIALLYLTAPAVAAFARYEMIDGLHGRSASELPPWFRNWEKTGLIAWFDDGDQKLAYYGPARASENEVFRRGSLAATDFDALRLEHAEWLASEQQRGRDVRPTLIQKQLAGPDRDIFVLAAPEMSELSAWIIALVAAGGLAAALSTASGLLLVISSSVAHDLYYRVLRPGASEAKRLFVGRLVIGVAVVIAGLFGIYPPGFVSQVVAFAFGLAASSFFPVLVLGIFHRRLGTTPAVVGMVTGLVFTASYIIGTVYFAMSRWCFGLGPQAIGSVGMLLNFAVALALAPYCAKSSAAMQATLEELRQP